MNASRARAKGVPCHRSGALAAATYSKLLRVISTSHSTAAYETSVSLSCRLMPPPFPLARRHVKTLYTLSRPPPRESPFPSPHQAYGNLSPVSPQPNHAPTVSLRRGPKVSEKPVGTTVPNSSPRGEATMPDGRPQEEEVGGRQLVSDTVLVYERRPVCTRPRFLCAEHANRTS